MRYWLRVIESGRNKLKIKGLLDAIGGGNDDEEVLAGEFESEEESEEEKTLQRADGAEAETDEQ